MGPQASLDLTHVLYDDSSYISTLLALLTLSPILLMPAYAALAVQSREYCVIMMFLGQLAGEAFNLVLKRTIKQERPSYSAAPGYGFPSSHSQYMGYFASFLMLHLFFRHRFAASGYRILDQAFRVVVYLALFSWTLVVAYSRYHLQYHSVPQIAWGLGIGVGLGTWWYAICEHIPRTRPRSLLGTLKTFCITNPISTWLQIRDGWDVWADGGREVEWHRWRSEWDKRRSDKKST
ncbi:hypothetical protein FB45DRAFT_924755 [Roridomyces roridus]|uniref:Phosphatidic acid phosphatase type 2/haloperoxidase domain-containing protein n=1 Tax=Roridomyces roridus TaxID=1738132 RepID=A0AAD7BJR9_9AGAR|nr:hypothetical protein FB45DRAFT_924755 [Roridomyces roridus]